MSYMDFCFLWHNLNILAMDKNIEHRAALYNLYTPIYYIRE